MAEVCKGRNLERRGASRRGQPARSSTCCPAGSPAARGPSAAGRAALGFSAEAPGLQRARAGRSEHEHTSGARGRGLPGAPR